MRLISLLITIQLFASLAHATGQCFAFPRNNHSDRIAAQQVLTSEATRLLDLELAEALKNSGEWVRIIGIEGINRVTEGKIVATERTGCSLETRIGFRTGIAFGRGAKLLPPETPDERRERFVNAQKSLKPHEQIRIEDLLRAKENGNTVEVRIHKHSSLGDPVTYVWSGRIQWVDVIENWSTDDKGPMKHADVIEIGIGHPESRTDHYDEYGDYSHTDTVGFILQAPKAVAYPVTGPKALHPKDLTILPLSKKP